jgi:hypothetical protein
MSVDEFRNIVYFAKSIVKTELHTGRGSHVLPIYDEPERIVVVILGHLSAAEGLLCFVWHLDRLVSNEYVGRRKSARK